MRAAALLVLLTGLLAACSKSGDPAPAPGFTPADVQRTIDAELPRTFGGLKVGPARCPADLDPQPDKPGACSLTVEGVPVRVRVDRKDDAHFAVATDQAVIPVGTLERSLEPAVSAKGKQSYSVDCGDEAVKVFDPPGKVSCVATPASGTPVTLVVTVSDKAGNYTFEPEKDS